MVRSRRSRHLASVMLIAGAVLGYSAAPAPASTAELVDVVVAPCKPDTGSCSGPLTETALVYLGGGEANRVGLAAGDGDIRIGDPGAQIEPGPGCTRVDANRVSCSVPQLGVYVGTGGGSDRVTSELAAATALIADGGAGNDRLVGGSGADFLFAGTGRDRLRGRGGADRLFEAAPGDPLRSGETSPFGNAFFPALPSPGRARDSYDGGSGRDTLSYQGRAANLRVDLSSSAPAAGARRERDSIRRVENAIGGAGDDRLAGNRRANDLEGAGGDDRLVGRGGADGLQGNAGNDAIRAGAGNDRINFPDVAGADRISCGSGRDLVGTAFPRDFLSGDCEETGLGSLTQAKLNGGLLRLLLPLREGRPPRVLSGELSSFVEIAAQVRLELRVRGPGVSGGTAPPRGTLLGSQSFALAPGEAKSVDLRLSSDGLRLLRRHRALRVRIIVASQYSGSRPPGFVTRLRAP